MNGSTPGLPVHHQLLEFTQTHAHRVSDAIQLAWASLAQRFPASSVLAREGAGCGSPEEGEGLQDPAAESPGELPPPLRKT